MRIQANKQGGRTIHQEAVLPATLVIVAVSVVGWRVGGALIIVVVSVVGQRV